MGTSRPIGEQGDKSTPASLRLALPAGAEVARSFRPGQFTPGRFQSRSCPTGRVPFGPCLARCRPAPLPYWGRTPVSGRGAVARADFTQGVQHYLRPWQSRRLRLPAVGVLRGGTTQMDHISLADNAPPTGR
jgi:hypothetical protein